MVEMSVILELKKDGLWKVERGRNESAWKFFKNRLDKIESDPALEMRLIFNGALALIKDAAERFDNDPFWIDVNGEDHRLPAILSNVHNFDELFSFTSENTLKPFFDCPDISEEADSLFREEPYHSFTVLYGNKIDDVYNIIEKNKEHNRINKLTADRAKTLFREKFESVVKKYIEKGFKKCDIRFLIAY